MVSHRWRAVPHGWGALALRDNPCHHASQTRHAFAKHLGWDEQSKHQKPLGFKIVEEAGLRQRCRVVSSQIQLPSRFAANPRQLDDCARRLPHLQSEWSDLLESSLLTAQERPLSGSGGVLYMDTQPLVQRL